MNPPPDYHLHTLLCRHAKGTATELAAQAVQLGFAEIGFSEHNPMPRDDFDDWHMSLGDLDAYVAQVEQARRDHPSLTIRLGLEVDYIPGHEDWIKDLATRAPWDYFIGAVHYVSDSWALDNPYVLEEWRSRDVDEVWAEYFRRQTLAAESGLFEIIAHPDLAKKFRFYPKQDVTPLYEKFVAALRKHEVAMELNTAGLRKDCQEIYPSAALVRIAARAGVPVTFASDAHAPHEVGAAFAEAVALARDCGVTTTCRFNQRRRVLFPL